MRDFNFFLPYLNDKKERKNKKVYILTTLVILGVIVLGSLAYNSIYILRLKGDINALKSIYETSDNQEKLAKAEEQIKTYNILSDYNKELEIISSGIVNRKIVNSKLLFDVSSSIPKEISFKTMSIESNTVSIQGISTTKVAIAELTHNLKAVNALTNVHVGNINLEGDVADGQYSFSVKCTLKDVNNNEAK